MCCVQRRYSMCVQCNFLVDAAESCSGLQYIVWPWYLLLFLDLLSYIALFLTKAPNDLVVAEFLLGGLHGLVQTMLLAKGVGKRHSLQDRWPIVRVAFQL